MGILYLFLVLDMRECGIVYTVTMNTARAMTVFAIAEALTIATAIAIAIAYSHVPFESVELVTTLSLQEGGLHNSHNLWV